MQNSANKTSKQECCCSSRYYKAAEKVNSYSLQQKEVCLTDKLTRMKNKARERKIKEDRILLVNVHLT